MHKKVCMYLSINSNYVEVNSLENFGIQFNSDIMICFGNTLSSAISYPFFHNHSYGMFPITSCTATLLEICPCILWHSLMNYLADVRTVYAQAIPKAMVAITTRSGHRLVNCSMCTMSKHVKYSVFDILGVLN